MAEILTLKIGGELFQYSLLKLSRPQLYGYSEIVALENNNQCKPGKLIDGHICNNAPYEQGYIDAEGNWYTLNELVQVDQTGAPLKVWPAMGKLEFDLGLPETMISYHEFLEYDTKALYAIQGETEHADPVLNDMLQAINGFYTLPGFTMRDSFKETIGILLHKNGNNYLLIAEIPSFPMLSVESIDYDLIEQFDIDTLDFEAL